MHYNIYIYIYIYIYGSRTDYRSTVPLVSCVDVSFSTMYTRARAYMHVHTARSHSPSQKLLHCNMTEPPNKIPIHTYKHARGIHTYVWCFACQLVGQKKKRSNFPSTAVCKLNIKFSQTPWLEWEKNRIVFFFCLANSNPKHIITYIHTYIHTCMRFHCIYIYIPTQTQSTLRSGQRERASMCLHSCRYGGDMVQASAFFVGTLYPDLILCQYTYIHTYIRTYIHTYIHTYYMHKHIHRK
jgi:hypothetical protein